jgi:hypothetical protein
MKIGGKEIDLGAITTGAKGILGVIKEIGSELSSISTKSAEVTTNLSKVSGTKKNGGQIGVGSTGGNRMQTSLAPVNASGQSSGGSTIMPNQSGMKTAGVGGGAGTAMGGNNNAAIGNAGGSFAATMGGKPTDVGVMIANVASGFTQMLPDVDATMQRAGSYYRANLFAGNPMGRANLQGHTLRGLGDNLT